MKVGSRIRLVAKLAEVEDVPGGAQITVEGAIEIEGGSKPAGGAAEPVAVLRLRPRGHQVEQAFRGVARER